MKSWLIATTEPVVRWYAFDPVAPATSIELLEQLDLDRVPAFASKESCKDAAIALGLKTWRYVRI